MTATPGAPAIRVGRSLLPDILWSFLLALSFSLWMAFSIGRNLGLFFAGLVLATILAPMLVAGKNSISRCVSIAAAIALVWLSCVFNDAVTLSEWFRATLVLLFYTLSISGLAAVVSRFHIPPAAIVLLALAWLSWPIWLAPWLRRESSEHIVA